MNTMILVFGAVWALGIPACGLGFWMILKEGSPEGNLIRDALDTNPTAGLMVAVLIVFWPAAVVASALMRKK